MKKITVFILAFPFILVAQAPANWQSRGIGGGGSLYSPSINPANHSEIYVACDMTELFHTTNKGQSWTETNFLQVQGGHDSYVSFTNNANILYTVDYTSINGNDYIRPMKSANGGSTWSVISGNPYPTSPNGDILRLIADYNNPNRVLIADYGTIYFSANGGNSFTQIHTATNSGAGNHIAGVFYYGNNIYIGTNDGIIYSTNGGTSFSAMTMNGFGSGEQMLSFSGAHEGNTVRFLCLTADAADVYAGFQGSDYSGAMKGVYTMDNATGTWTNKMGGITLNSDYPVFCGMANNDVDTMYISGGSSASYPIVMRATNTTNWLHVFNTTANQNIATGWCGASGDKDWGFAESPFGFQVCPNSSKIVTLSDFGFVHITYDGATSWNQQYVNVADQHAAGANTPKQKTYHSIGMENTTNWNIMWADSSNMYASFSDITGVMSSDKGNGWKFIPNITQNSIYHMVKAPNGTIYAATSSVHDMYQSTRIFDSQINSGTGAVYYSTNNGTSFTQLHNFSHPVVWLALDPTNANRMYASVLNGSTGTGGIYVTNNLSAGVSSTWTKMSKPPRSNGHPFTITVLNNGDLVASFCARKPTSSSSFTDSSGVYYYNNTTSTWADRSASGMHYWTKDVVVDPNDATQSTWYAAVFSGWSNVPAGTGGVYKTTNKGQSWTQISTSYRVNSVSINPQNANELYFTTETEGLWYSNNATNSAPSFSQVSSYPFRSPVRVFFNPYKNSEIWVSSFGNGMMMGTEPQTTNIAYITNFSNKELLIFPNPAKELLTINTREAVDEVIVYDYSGKEVLRSNQAENLPVSKLSAGLYIVQIRCGGRITAGKVMIEKH